MADDLHPYEGLLIRDGELKKAMTAGKWWRRATYGLLGIVGILVCSNTYLGALPKWKPYYVEVDTCSGTVRVVGAAQFGSSSVSLIASTG